MDLAIPPEPDWSAASARLLVACEAAVDRFAKEHPAECCSFLAFAVGECFGEVVLAFDTLANGMARARRHEAMAVRTRTRTLSAEYGWRNAGFHLNRTPIAAHAPSTSEFAFADFARVHFPDWEPYFLEHRRPGEPDPTGKVAMLLQGVANSVVQRGRLSRLNLASPCYVGGEFARDDLGLVVLRAVNWPA
ncbi:MAG: hypothetical protein BGO49_03710 [Planctomycetales bacterium 71-10]|nr:MAG: hypothetical protein BGO49_03710 [Planctomycetales bacterium 71-10]